MLSRCSDPRNQNYPRYGGRGIKVCEEWLSVETFFSDMGERENGFSLERIDNEKGYCPDNCKWSTSREQARNRRTNVVIEHNGKRMLLLDWAKELGITYQSLRYRLKNWPLERALSNTELEASILGSMRGGN